MNEQKKILVVVGNLSHLDQFVIHKFFEELSGSVDVYLTLPEQDLTSARWDEISLLKSGVFTKVIPYKYSAQSKKAGSQLGAALTYHHRKKSESYRVRILESFFGGFNMPLEKFNRQSVVTLLKNRRVFFQRIVHETPAAVRGSKPFFWLWFKSISRKISSGCEIKQSIEICKPDAIIILMQRQAAFVVASIDAGSATNIPTLLIPYKWDNASSKSPLIRTPTKMLVYNSAIQEICAQLHKMSLSAVVAVGSVEIGKGKLCGLNTSSTVIPLIGATTDTKSARPWLIHVDALLAKIPQENDIQNWSLKWRPYPTADIKNIEFMHEFVAQHPRIELDEDIAAAVSHRSSNLSFSETQTSYFRYIHLLESAMFVISEGTSVIVDARARGLAVIFPAFKRDAVIGSQWHRLNTSNHLKGLKVTTGVFVAEDEGELERLVLDLLMNPRRILPDNSGENIFVDERTYAQRVLDVVDEVLAETLIKN